MMSNSLTLRVVIATLDRPLDLRRVLEDLRDGTFLPSEVVVVDASEGRDSANICNETWHPLNLTYLHAAQKSAARQRNLGAYNCHTDLIAFCDDDIEIPSDALRQLCEVLISDPEQYIGGVAGMIVGLHHKVPRRPLRWYYSLQAGYQHEHFGGHFFGAGINILPTNRPEDPILYESQWLNSTFVIYRTHLFSREKFPEFAGYSFQEDVNLSARVRHSHRLVFHRGVQYVHKASPANYRSNIQQLATMQIIHRWHNTKVILRTGRSKCIYKFLFSMIFDTTLHLYARPPYWQHWIRGSWLAFWKLAILNIPSESLLRSSHDF